MRKRNKLKINFGFLINVIFAVFHCFLGMYSHSCWFFTIGTYYIILSVMRFLIIMFSVKNKDAENFVMKFSGWLLLLLSVILAGIVMMTVKYDKGTRYHEIVMISIALYAFTKVTLAIVKFIKSKKNQSSLVKTMQSIALTDAAVSIYSLQRSMLVSFEGMAAETIILFNTLSGIVLCLIVIVIGIYLIRERM